MLATRMWGSELSEEHAIWHGPAACYAGQGFASYSTERGAGVVAGAVKTAVAVLAAFAATAKSRSLQL